MPVGSVGKWLVLGTLVAALGASGCKEDDGDDNPSGNDAGGGTPDSGGGAVDSGTVTDAGPKDSGTPTDAGSDAAPPVVCGGKTCMTYSPNALVPAFPAGCAKSVADAEVCGLAGYGANAYPEAGFPAFLERDAPGVASPTCGAFLESKIEQPTDAGTADAGQMNGLIDTKRTLTLAGMTFDVALIYPGCCTPLGFCTGDTAKGTSISSLAPASASNGGFGCLDPKVFLQAAPAALQQVPCDPTTGVIKAAAPSDGGVDGGGDGGASDAGADGGNG